MKSHSRRLQSNFSVGAEQAEADPLLQEAFYETDDYRTIESKSDPRCFLIARTGSGKSAALQRLEEEHPDHVVRISPEDLSLPYITDLQVIRYLDELQVKLEPLFSALWKHVLLIELIKHRFKVNSPDAKRNFILGLRDRIKRDPGKRAALEYLEEFGSNFWAPTDERVREITENFESRIRADEAKLSITGLGEASIGGGPETSSSVGVRTELSARYQRIVNETQLARLNKMIKVLNDDILDSKHHFTYVVIDDLDREWVDEGVANTLIRCLFLTVLQLGRVRNLKVIVALRTNIFQQLNFGERSGGQEEKFRALVLKLRWTPIQLKDMLSLRVEALNRDTSEAESVYDFLPHVNQRRGDPLDYMISRTLMRPRDIIAYLNESFSYAGGKDRLSWDDIHEAEREYSRNRLLALRDEWKSSFPDVERVLEVFNNAEVPLGKGDFTKYLNEVALLVAQRDFVGHEWISEMTSAMWNSNSEETWSVWYGSLAAFLYDIGFVGFSSNERARPIYCYDQPGFASRPSNLENSAYFTIHPAFQAGLDIRQRRVPRF